jgi:hypothetical protein
MMGIAPPISRTNHLIKERALGTTTPTPWHARRAANGMDRSTPACQTPSQGRAAGLIRDGHQATPGRALTQKAPQCRHDPDRRARWVAGTTARRLVKGIDDHGDEMQEPEVQCCCPCLVPRLGQSQRRSANRLTQPSVIVNRIVFLYIFNIFFSSNLAQILLASTARWALSLIGGVEQHET